MIELIPAIDIINGKCVRLAKGNYDTKTVYSDSPAEVAKKFECMGFRRLHVVDLDGAKSKHIVNADVLHDISSATNLIIDFGGGIKTDNDIETAFANGASMVTIGSVAVTAPQICTEWINKYGADKIIIGADVKGRNISINGWKDTSSQTLFPFMKFYIENGVKTFLCTDIDKDGMLAGPATDLYKEILEQFPDIHLIASGGVASIEDIKALEYNGIPAVVFGKAIYEGKINMKELWDWQNA
ncbi:1-(5-phosphoribosyl)-5-[(5-phosphoribosylamino)methylideneamino]imidazole-4-carboxamide isomerase [Xylanibacter muris]|uniref:1-(5-phosphoribosyl)-5-[(5-phosphoribosylamino)methylideneamino] imidazole-4-carboxamide isomerase n=1 Tax=Xylanibacter muris TaxID=2736290 RepID=A0ABX2AMB3_9BACT|nr:1-(5-phosphoribosyl)-5-[(5-phosphoribosylamino)methylideneamino]imidazole-4-carboxamide isomerase [Xylanibacter muris]NPD91392.1 1-(5-phosphoribosyl)-5-[(5-phosphoribosylamino)methylideneamino]imidazole-4-carboxamide isomerase [Xylanibacter muris]